VAKALKTPVVSGQGKEVQWSASKQAKALSPELYFPHVDFATDRFHNFLKVFSVFTVSAEGGRSIDISAAVRDCMWNLVSEANLSRRCGAAQNPIIHGWRGGGGVNINCVNISHGNMILTKSD
jgi:hypothetical protein